ncbi:MAG: translation initiation factor IF-2 [Candidatus Omnitrophica bacterium]|nr:translation initiation factor IF-2 [Candidatus Omnitrophota bacterium]
MRIHGLAKKIGKTSKDILALCKKLGVDAKSHMTMLADADATKVESHFKDTTGTIPLPAAKAEKAKPAKKAAAKPKKNVSGKKEANIKKEPLSGKQKEKKNISDIVKKRIAQKLSAPGPVLPKRTPQRRARQQKTPTDMPTAEHAAGADVIARQPAAQATAVKEVPTRTVQIRLPITVGALATNIEVKTSALIKALMQEGIFANVNQLLNEEIAARVALKFNVLIESLPTEEQELILQHEGKDDEKDLEQRAPVVTLMGHVDHGKTSLLDAIRNSRLVDREAGKITQHIGAYSVEIGDKGYVTFLDTPGHEAFTEMRARGANVTDIVVLVVAADDGVMPQTVEAINHSKAAGVPMVVAINKSDLPGAHPDRVKKELQKYDLVPEEWGGKTIMVKVSALKRTGIDELLEMLLLEAEVLELKANPSRPAQGVALEARLTKSHGPVTNVLLTNGTLKVGDYVICGKYYGKVRAMHNDLSKNIKTAGPSKPVEIFGIQGVPNAADRFYVVEDEKTARRISEQKMLQEKEKELNAQLTKHMSLESLHDKMTRGERVELKMILKADVQGSVEVLQSSLQKLSSDKVSLNIVHSGVGGINESDVMLAAVSDAIIIGFHVKANIKAQALVEKEGIDLRYYTIIYEAIQDMKTAMEGKLAPTYKEVFMGMTEVREIFKASKIGTIGGCYVVKGKIARTHKIRVLRSDIVIYEGSLSSLKRFKDDAREIKDGFECGLTIANFNDLKVGDMIESYVQQAVATKL